MNARQIADLTRAYLDDPDEVFLSQSRLALFLDLAYNEFRQRTPQEIWEVMYAPAALTGQATIDLSAAMFGATPTTGKRCQRITRVLLVDAVTGLLQCILEPASSFESLSPVQSSASGAFVAYGARWWLDGHILRFSAPMAGNIQIWYMPDSTVNWSAGIAPGANVYIDDLVQFHDIIALLAAGHYSAADGAIQASVKIKKDERLNDMQAFYAQSRSGQGSRYVREDTGYVRY